ncbi:MAG: PIG-L deacetylase family protein [Candidatus Limnocylindrales bacterium]
MIKLLPATDRPLRVLAIGAHADDIEIGAGGLLLSLLQGGHVAEVDWVVLSAEGVRADEALTSAQQLVGDQADLRPVIGDFRERFFPHQPEIKAMVDDLGRRLQPDLILAPRLEDRHQDHRVVAELVWQAFRDHLVLEYEIPKYEGDLGTPNLYQHLSAAIVDAKVEHLLRTFPSQAHRSWFDASAFRAILRLRGIESNAPSGSAEAFTARKVTLVASP